MSGIDTILEVLENATLAELMDELELVESYENQYPPFFKHLLLAELEKRTETKKEVEE